MSADARPADGTSLPPVTELGVTSLALTIVGGILMASYVPHRPPLTAPAILLAASGALMLAAIAGVVRARHLARRPFMTVAAWALLAYAVSAGLIEFAFVRNHTRGAPLLVVTLMLVVFAVDVPLIIGFTVARFEHPPA